MPQHELVMSDLFRRSFQRHADKIAVATRSESLTYRELAGRAQALHGVMRGAGISAGDPVVLLLRNSIDFIVADLALIMLGACKVPLNDLLAPDDISYMIEHSGAVAIIAHSSFAETLGSVEAALAPLRLRLSIKDSDAAPGGFEPMTFGADSGEKDIDWPSAGAIASSGNALLIYTGGTTGRPKGVLHSQRNLFLNLLSHQLHLHIRHDDHLLVCSPLPHSAQMFAAAVLVSGGRVWIETSFDAGRTLELIQSERITMTFMVPTMIYRILDHPASPTTDTSCVRTIVYGASPITSTRLKEALDRFGPVLTQIYGQTEVPNLITTLSKEDHLVEEYRMSCGQPVLFGDVVIRDEAGNPKGSGEVGEVTVRSYYGLERYHDDPERTEEAFVGDYLRTGDVGYLGDTGHLYLVDRAKDMIISGGFNVYSTEVENVLVQHGSVQQAVVIGVPDDEWGEAVTAFVMTNDSSFDVDLALQHCRQHLARYKVPKAIHVTDAIPLTAYGKPDKKSLRARYWSDSGRQIH